MPQEVNLNLSLLPPDTDQVDLAKRLGVSEATVRAYLENRWTVLDRTVMERLADLLQCDVGSLLKTTESSFLKAFKVLMGEEAHPTCLYLSRPDATTVQTGRPVAYRDSRAIQAVANWLRDLVDGMVGLELAATTPDQFKSCLQQNCVVLGSPMVNPAAEMALCHVFGAEPFNSSHREKLPFTFRVAPTAGVAPSTVLEPSHDGKRGIWLRREKELLQADSYSPEDFRKLPIKRGRDCAVIVVLNHQTPQDSASLRKLVILAGFGGVGTEEASVALVERYRDLEPRGDDTYAWGVIEVFYKKPAYSTNREILGHRWRYRKGGRCPIEFTKKKV
jgi:transcriptional regulator with XRE-family HTH domain